MRLDVIAATFAGIFAWGMFGIYPPLCKLFIGGLGMYVCWYWRSDGK